MRGACASKPREVPLDLVTAVNEKHSMSPVFLPLLKLAAELGECELPEHTPELVSEFRFIPNQTEAMEFDIFQRWKECRYLDAPILHSDVCFVTCTGLSGSFTDCKFIAPPLHLCPVLRSCFSQRPTRHLFAEMYSKNQCVLLFSL